METKNITKRVTADMTIGDFVQKYPSVVEILMAEGVHCVGCGASGFESIQEGLMGHGKTPEQIQDFLDRVNEALDLELGMEQPAAEVTITEATVTKVAELITKNNKEGHGLRIGVVSGGCSGSKYIFEFEKEPQENDKVYDINGIKFFIDEPSMSQLKGSTINYVETLSESGFKVDNPNAKSGCGCGKSFN